MPARHPGSTADVELAAAIVMHRDSVLVVRRSMAERFLPGAWGLPCGKVDAGENPGDAVLRELREETGLDGTAIKFAGDSVPFQSNFRGSTVWNRQRNYLVQLCGAALRAQQPPVVDLPDETQEARWVPADEIETAGLDEHNLRAIRQGLTCYQQSQRDSSPMTAARPRA